MRQLLVYFSALHVYIGVSEFSAWVYPTICCVLFCSLILFQGVRMFYDIAKKRYISDKIANFDEIFVCIYWF